MAAEPEGVAVITGGSRGMGLAVAQALAAKGGWKINLIDIKDEEGKRAADSLSNTTYHRANLVNYEEVTAAFKKAFLDGNNRLDFVFANAGVIESSNLYAKHDSVDAPPPPDLTAVEVNLKSCPAKRTFNLEVGILGFMRSVADYYKHEGIRVNALCPGAVRTPIVSDQAWKAMPEDVFTPMELISEIVLKLAGGEELVDANGERAASDELYGKAVVANGKNIYIQHDTPYCDDRMARIVENTRMGKQTAV
ncbi:hypothetical protein Daus18300_011647 [Diaporthe australafricana]|uniref:Uncharacterized protein n=1 Tax=Diaporthe australafricana TaxID=127596 RepID=A0ABR3W5Q3_9PEZI